MYNYSGSNDNTTATDYINTNFCSGNLRTIEWFCECYCIRRDSAIQLLLEYNSCTDNTKRIRTSVWKLYGYCYGCKRMHCYCNSCSICCSRTNSYYLSTDKYFM